MTFGAISPSRAEARKLRPARVGARAAGHEPQLLAQVRDALVLDARASGKLSRCLRAMWYDVNACMTLTADDYEMAKPRHALRQYLEKEGFDARQQARELAAARQETGDDEEAIDPVGGLVELMLSDRQADALMRHLATRVEEPLLRELLLKLAVHRQRRIRRIAHLVVRRMSGRDEESLGVRSCLTALWGES